MPVFCVRSRSLEPSRCNFFSINACSILLNCCSLLFFISFPYEWFRTIEQLDTTTELPPRNPAFFSRLKQSYLCTEKEYENLRKIWDEEGMETMREFLTYYGEQVCIFFLKNCFSLSFSKIIFLFRMWSRFCGQFQNLWPIGVGNTASTP